MSVSEWFVWLFTEILSVINLSIVFSIGIIFLTILVLFVNGFGSNMAKLSKLDKKMNVFFKTNAAISFDNALSFSKKCVRFMPVKVKKAWKNFEISGKNIEDVGLDKVIRTTFNKGGTVWFLVYLYFYLFVVFSLIVSIVVSRVESDIVSLCVSGILILGAVCLIILACQLYFMDKKIEKKVDNIITNFNVRTIMNKKPLVKCISQKKANCLSEIEGCSKVCTTRKSIDDLEGLIADLNRDCVSQEIKDIIKDMMRKVSDTAYNSPVDNLKLNRLIESIK